MKPMSEAEITEKINRCGVIAVVVIDSADDAVPLANALLKGGISVMEITLRTDAAFDAIGSIINSSLQMTAGAGTVITPEQVKKTAEVGAAFGVARLQTPES